MNLVQRDIGRLARRRLDHLLQCLLGYRAFSLEATHLLPDVVLG
jgi:hypothetical protein